jgi:Region in Clathrin and VPS
MAYGSRTLLVHNILLLLLNLNSLHFFADSYIKAEDPANFAEVIKISNHAGKHDDLVRFLQMACKSLREPKIDMELAYAYAKTNRLHGMEDFLSMTNVADIPEVGEYTWARTKLQWRVLGKPETTSESFHILSQS